jgi:uncharacterized protein (TIRG00374 family)
MKKGQTFILRLIVGLSLIFFIFSKIEWNEFINTITRINPIFVFIPIILFFFPGVWLSVLKWKKLLAIYNINASFKQLYLYYLIGTFFNNFLPTTVGGDVSRVMYLKRVTNRPAEIAASIIMERLTGFLALIFLGVFSVIFNLSFVLQYPVAVNITMLIFLVLIIVYLLLRNGTLKKPFCKSRLLILLWGKINEVSEVLYSYRNHKKVLVLTFILSIMFISFGVFSTYLYFLAIAINVPILKLILIYTVVQLMGLLPISINSIGITEGSYIILFGLIGINSVDALTVALLGRVLLMLLSLSGGVAFIFQSKLSDTIKSY